MLDLGELFNRAPQFVSEPDTLAVTGEAYSYEISVFDPDPSDTIGIWAEQLPEWLTLIDSGDGTALLSGTPAEPGICQVVLKTGDSYGAEDIQEFEIHVGIVAVEEIYNSSFQNYPNPFTSHAFIEFDLPRTCLVSIQIFNALGAKVAELHHGQLPAGQQQFTWHAGDLPKGMYLCRVLAGEETGTFKIIKNQ